jgi:hypothetical protein
MHAKNLDKVETVKNGLSAGATTDTAASEIIGNKNVDLKGKIIDYLWWMEKTRLRPRDHPRQQFLLASIAN